MENGFLSIVSTIVGLIKNLFTSKNGKVNKQKVSKSRNSVNIQANGNIITGKSNNQYINSSK